MDALNEEFLLFLLIKEILVSVISSPQNIPAKVKCKLFHTSILMIAYQIIWAEKQMP